jgi:hypothetical protein
MRGSPLPSAHGRGAADGSSKTPQKQTGQALCLLHATSSQPRGSVRRSMEVHGSNLGGAAAWQASVIAGF